MQKDKKIDCDKSYMAYSKASTTPASFQRKLEPRPYSLERFYHNFIYIFQYSFQENYQIKNSSTLPKDTSLKDLGSSFRWNDAGVRVYAINNIMGWNDNVPTY